VKAHVTVILKKLGVNNGTQTVLPTRRVLWPDA
jgi:DNA-binding NarL/FixJ family response regulator